MAFIKKPPDHIEPTLHLERPVSELLDEYRRFVECPADYVANFALREMLAHDPGYRKWKANQVSAARTEKTSPAGAAKAS